jgi:hypothetical protein
MSTLAVLKLKLCAWAFKVHFFHTNFLAQTKYF